MSVSLPIAIALAIVMPLIAIVAAVISNGLTHWLTLLLTFVAIVAAIVVSVLVDFRIAEIGGGRVSDDTVFGFVVQAIVLLVGVGGWIFALADELDLG